MATTDKLTDTAIRGANRRAKPYKLFDGGGLYVLVWPDGKKYWRVKYYVLSVKKLIALGVYPAVTLASAEGETTTEKIVGLSSQLPEIVRDADGRYVTFNQ